MTAPTAIRRLNAADPDFAQHLDHLLSWESVSDDSVNQRVLDIIKAVRERGDAALVEFTQRFDGLTVNSMADLILPRERLKSAGLPVPEQGPEFMTRELIKVGNRDLNGNDFTWVVGEWLTNQSMPPELMAIERREWGNFYGYLVNVKENGKVVAEG